MILIFNVLSIIMEIMGVYVLDNFSDKVKAGE